jgi:hypothetical protein
MKELLMIFLGLLIITGCQERDETLMRYNFTEGVYYEVIDEGANEGGNPYNKDNKIYQPGKEFIFKYSYQDTTGRDYLFSREGYELTPVDSITNGTLTKVSLKIEKGLSGFEPDYYQTITEYRYYIPSGESIYPKIHSGIVENEKNVWMHPFRNPCYFRLLQLSPFPYIQKPAVIGKKWKWALKTGRNYECKQWGEWEDVVDSQYVYEIIGEEQINTALGIQDCYVIKSTGKGNLGETELISYFNEENGFVRLEYENVNKSKLILELIEIKR